MKLEEKNFAEVTLQYGSKIKSSDKFAVAKSCDAVEYLRKVWTDSLEHYESFYVLLLNRSNKINGHFLLSKGGIAGTVADIRIVMQAAILSNSSGIILAHNHPSGALLPSNEDKILTNKMIEAARILDISVLDHVILSADSYFSFSDSGFL